MRWLPEVDPQSNPEIAEVFGRVRASRGWVSNALKGLAHAPEGLRTFSGAGHYCRYGTELTEIERELAILVTGRKVPYAWAHHAPLGLQAGLTQAEIDAIGAGAVPATLSAADQSLCRYVQAFLAGQGIPAAVRAEIARHFTSRQITDISMIAGYYLALGTLIIALGVEVEPPEVLAIELAWQKRQASTTPEAR